MKMGVVGSGRTGHRKWSTGVQPARRRVSGQEQAKRARAKKRPAARGTVIFIPPAPPKVCSLAADH